MIVVACGTCRPHGSAEQHPLQSGHSSSELARSIAWGRSRRRLHARDVSQSSKTATSGPDPRSSACGRVVGHGAAGTTVWRRSRSVLVWRNASTMVVAQRLHDVAAQQLGVLPLDGLQSAGGDELGCSVDLLGERVRAGLRPERGPLGICAPPSRIVSARAMEAPIAAPTSSLMNGGCQVSGASVTPSRVMNSPAVILRMAGDVLSNGRGGGGWPRGDGHSVFLRPARQRKLIDA